MASRVYTTEQVDPLLKAARTLVGSLVEIIENQQEETNKLRQELSVAKAAAANKVEMDKVASERAVTPEQASEFASMLVSHGIIDSDNQEKFASNFMTSPAFTLKAAMNALKLSEAPVSEGRGTKAATSKEASVEDEERTCELRAWSEFLNPAGK